MPQIDLTPTVALLMGVPIPYGNLGKVPPQLWRVLAEPAGGSESDPGCSGGGGCGGRRGASYAAAVAANAAQVHRYLNHYARVAKLPSKPLARCNELYVKASSAAAAAAGTSAGGVGGDDEALDSWLAFLDAAAALARTQFTQFHGGYIWSGVVAVAGVAAVHLYLCW
jgi:hypothetical protein